MAPDFARYLAAKKKIEKGELIFIARQMDVLARIPNEDNYY